MDALQDVDVPELLEDNEKLRNELERLEIYHFKAKKNALTQPQRFVPRNLEVISRQASMLGNITHQSKRIKIYNILTHYLRYGGLMVKEYTSDSCIVLFKISILGESVSEYAIQMSKIGDSDEWELKSYHLPIAFCLDVIKSKCEIMSTHFFSLMHKALTNHHDRLYQIQKLNNIIPNYAQISNRLNGSLVELELYIGTQDEQDNEIMEILITLHYDPLESRPNDIEITKSGISDSIEINDLKQQIQVFRFVTLADGFIKGFRSDENKYYCLSDLEMREYEQSLNFQKDSKKNVDMYRNENSEVSKYNSRRNKGNIISNSQDGLSQNYNSDTNVLRINTDANIQRSQPRDHYRGRISDISRYSPEAVKEGKKRTHSKEPVSKKKETKKLRVMSNVTQEDESPIRKRGRPGKSSATKVTGKAKTRKG